MKCLGYVYLSRIFHLAETRVMTFKVPHTEAATPPDIVTVLRCTSHFFFVVGCVAVATSLTKLRCINLGRAS